MGLHIHRKTLLVVKGEQTRQIKAALWNYANEHDGHYPPSLTIFTNTSLRYCRDFNITNWQEYYYVSGLTLADDRMRPILIYLPTHKRITKAIVWFKDGGCFFVEPQKARQLIASPSICIRDKEGSGFLISPEPSTTNNLKVLPPYTNSTP
jgi:hypothetical protein